MNRQEEIAFEKRAEKSFRSHPQLLNGRDFRMQTYRHELKSGQQKIREHWDGINWNSKQLCPTEEKLNNIKCRKWHELNKNRPNIFVRAKQPKCSECEYNCKDMY